MSTEVATKGMGGIIAPAGSWADRFGKLAEMSVEKVESSGNITGSWITAPAGQLHFKGNALTGNALDVIIVDFCRENQYYTDKFDRDNKASPVCYAFGDDLSLMDIHAASEKPQAASCNACPHNKFGSADNGRGKACKNVMRLGVLPAAPCTAEYLSKAEPAWIKIPVMSVKGFEAYVRTVKAKYGRPLLGVVTRISTKADPKAQFIWTFEDKAPLPEDDGLKNALEQRYNEIFDLIQFPHKPNEAATAGFDPKVSAKIS